MTLPTALKIWHSKEIIEIRGNWVGDPNSVIIRIKEESTLKYNWGQIWKKTTVSK